MNYFTSGYFDILNKMLEEYLYTNYRDDEEIQALLDTYQWEMPEMELFEIIDRELLYKFIEAGSWYHTPTKDEIEDLLSEEYISYFMDCSLSEVYNYFEEIPIKTVLLQTDIYKYNDMYYIIWEI